MSNTLAAREKSGATEETRKHVKSWGEIHSTYSSSRSKIIIIARTPSANHKVSPQYFYARCLSTIVLGRAHPLRTFLLYFPMEDKARPWNEGEEESHFESRGQGWMENQGKHIMDRVWTLPWVTSHHNCNQQQHDATYVWYTSTKLIAKNVAKCPTQWKIVLRTIIMSLEYFPIDWFAHATLLWSIRYNII